MDFTMMIPYLPYAVCFIIIAIIGVNICKGLFRLIFIALIVFIALTLFGVI